MLLEGGARRKKVRFRASLNAYGQKWTLELADEAFVLQAKRRLLEAFRQHRASFAPEVKERHVLIIKFDNKGAMQSLEHKDVTDGRQLAHVERLTPTFGQELTVIGQILGNFRRFKKNK